MSRFHGTFHSTMEPLNLSIRGHTTRPVQHAQKTPTNHLQLSRSFDGRDQEALRLRRETLAAKQKTMAHVEELEIPVLRSTIRQQTNATIQDFERDQKALVLSLREEETAGLKELQKLQRLTDQLQLFLEEHCRRAVWLNQQSIARRSGLEAAPDGVDLELQAEGRLTEQVLATVAKQHSINKGAMKALHAALNVAAQSIKREKASLDLNSEAYCGAVLKYPRPQGSAPPVVTQLRDQVRTVRHLCKETKEVMTASRTQLEQQRKAVDNRLQAAIAKAKSAAADVHITRGEIRNALHKTSATAFKTEIIDEVNEGPREGRFARVADSRSRPVIRSYTRAPKTNNGGVDRWEASQRAHRSLTQARTDLNHDVEDLRSKHQRLHAAAVDCRNVAKRDEELLRFRRRCMPGNRVITRP
eukprot:m.192175 g.192175  ORF g.192175 m.192175 type:complete len:415 (+) comp16764_c0_seq5:130-1374(+)